MASGGSGLTSDEIVNIKCCVCTEENRTREAEKYCVQCKDYYCSSCSSCIDIHKKVPSLKGHKLLDKADFTTSGQDGSLPSFPTERCTVHQSEVVNTYCKDHDEVVCALCVVVNHRTCVNIKPISADIDNLYNDIEITPVKQKLAKTIETIKTWKTATEIKLDTLQRSLTETEDAVKRFRGELEALLDEMEQRTLNELRCEFNKISQSLKGNIEEMETMIKCLNDARDKVNKAVGNRAQEFVSVKMSQKEISKDEKLWKEQNQQQQESITFIPDKHVKESLQVFQTFRKAFKPKDTLYQVKSTKEINAKLPSDQSSCYLYGSCKIDDDCLLVTDIYNKKLKRLDLSTDTIKDYLDFPAGPIAVCQVSRTEAAVTLKNKTVHFISLGDQMAVTRTLQMEHYCSGIAYTGGILFISDEKKTVFVRDMKGQEVQKISTDAAGRDIFQCTRHISVSAGGDRVFVADVDKGLVTLDNQGNYISTFNSEKAGGCLNACTDGRNIFICCYVSGKILQGSTNYTTLGETGSVSNPNSVAFDRLRNRLLVTSCGSNNITVLDLQ